MNDDPDMLSHYDFRGGIRGKYVGRFDDRRTVEREKSMKYRVLIEQDEDGVFVAQVPSLPGCISQGTTRREAVSNIQEAIDLYLESLRAHRDSA